MTSFFHSLHDYLKIEKKKKKFIKQEDDDATKWNYEDKWNQNKNPTENKWKSE